MSIALHYSFRTIDHEATLATEDIQEEFVEQIYLKFCDVIKFPEWLTRLQNLSHINISCNAIENVPSSLSLISNLNYLDITKLCNLLLSGNQLLTCIPHETLQFVDSAMTTAEFYMVKVEDLEEMLKSQTDLVRGSSEIKHVELSDGTIASFPKEIERIFTAKSIESVSLKELCLRAATFHCDYDLPRHLQEILRFPTAICSCLGRVFIEAFVIFFYEKHQSNLQLLMTKFFCSKACLISFCDTNKDDLMIIN